MFQSFPDSSELMNQAIIFIIKDKTENRIEEIVYGFFLFETILILLFFITTNMELIKNNITKNITTTPKCGSICGPLTIEHNRFNKNVRGANIIHVRVIISPNNFFLI